jgi:arylsulfatase A-like enzyme/Tfp pilus assembly protein PilF
MQRRTKLRGLAVALAISVIGFLLICFCWPSHRVNVILVTLDTTRADHLGCYRYQRARTPAMDALANDGVLFERAYAPAPVTLPSHASMLTGLYPPEHGLHTNGRGRLGNTFPVLAEVLRSGHYETGAFIASFVLNSKFGLERGFQHYDDQFAEGGAAEDPVHQRRDGQIVMDHALAWLKERTGKPYFCWIHLYDAHGFYDSRPKVFGTEFTENPYDAGIAYLDLQIQRLREFLKTEKLAGRTLIVIVGDHGEDLMEHEEAQHGNQLYDTTLRVPLIFSGSPAVKSIARVSDPVSLVDLMPTILECVNVPQPARMTGRSVKAALAGGKIEARPCYAETDIPFLENRWAPLRGIVTERWKYIETTRSELFDMINDPHETRNLAEIQPEILQEMRNRLEEFTGQMLLREASAVNLTAKEQQILESLGYLGSHRDKTPTETVQNLPDIKDMLPLFNELMLARTLLHDGAVDSSLEKLRRIVEQAPSYVQARLVLGDALFFKKQFPEAAAIYKAVIAEQHGNNDAEGRLANTLAVQGQLEESVPYYRIVMKNEIISATYLIRFAQVLKDLGRPLEALKVLSDGVVENPQNISAQLELGSLLMQLGRMKESVPHFETVLKLQPHQTLARLNLASALASEGRYADAVAQVKKVIEIDPKSYEAQYTLGAILVTQNRHKEALQPLERACQLRPDDAAAKTLFQRAKSALGLR